MVKMMVRESWQRAEWTIAFTAVRSLLAFLCLEYWFLETSPKLSSPGLGAIYLINWHGTTVYLTAAQELDTNALFWGSIMLFLIALCVRVAEGFFNQRRN